MILTQAGKKNTLMKIRVHKKGKPIKTGIYAPTLRQLSHRIVLLTSSRLACPFPKGPSRCSDNVGLEFCVPGFPQVYLYRLN